MIDESRGVTGTPTLVAGRRPSGRTLERRRTLPSGRAVVGGFLIALAAVGGYGAVILNHSPLPRFVVATTTLRVGQRIVPSDLTTEPMRLPARLADSLAFTRPATLVGAVVVAPVRAGELLQVSDVVAPPGPAGDRELSFPVAPARALDGGLQPGDRIDVLATFGQGGSTVTTAVVEDADVVAVSSSSGGLAGSSDLVITVRLRTPAEVVALVNAVNTGEIVLVRASGDRPGRYPTVGAASASSASSPTATTARVSALASPEPGSLPTGSPHADGRQPASSDRGAP